MKKRVSIHDIARHLKVSSATVSLVLNGKGAQNHIRPELIEAIMNHAREVDYRPNLVAKSLRTGKSKILGMLVEGISNPFFASIASHVESEAYKAGYKLFYSSTENDPEKAKDLLRAFRERQVDGYIIAPTADIEPEISALVSDHYPVVLFDRTLPGVTASTVVIDNYRGSFDAARHLIKQGFRQIALITLDSAQQQMVDRSKGYEAALLEANMLPTILGLPYGAESDENVQTIRGFLQANDHLDAVLFATNYLALAGLQSIKSLELSIPEDLGVIAFDDNSFFNLISPSITAIAQPEREISLEIMRQLKAKLSNTQDPIPLETTVLKTQLIVRASSAARKLLRVVAH